jgi:TatD DNase family protein
MFIDTHAHLSSEVYRHKIKNILDECLANNVKKIITIGCTLQEIGASLALVEEYGNDYDLFATAGLYPHDNEEESGISISQRLQILEKLLENPKIVAVGECGLDLKVPGAPEIFRGLNFQIELFEFQLELARKYNKPLIIHSREAVKETLEVLQKYKDVKKVWHCFTENYETAKKALDYGCFLSFTGIITYPKNTDLKETVKQLPLENIMLETDAPYLTPMQARDLKIKTNSPAYVKMIAQEVSSLKNIHLDLVEETTSKNAVKFFHI